MRNLRQALVCTVLSLLCTQALSSTAVTENAYGLASAKQLALSNSVTWRRSGMRHLYDRMDNVREGRQTIGRWSVGQYQSWNIGQASCDHQFILLGSDLALNSQLTVGSTIDFGKGSSYYSQGSSESETMGASVYGTYGYSEGSYFGALIKVGMMRLRALLEGQKENENLSGIYLGAEYGHRWKPSQSTIVDPQIRLTYSRLSSETLRADRSDIRYQPIENLVLALKLRGEKSFNRDSQAYFVLGYYRDFSGQVSGKYRTLGRQQRFSDTLFDTWGRAKLGADYQFDDRVSASLQAEKNFGQEYRGSTNISCSANYRF